MVCRPSPRATGRQRTRLSTPLRGTARLPTTALKTTLYVGASIGADRGPSMHVGDVIACGPSSPSCTVVVVIGGFHNPRHRVECLSVEFLSLFPYTLSNARDARGRESDARTDRSMSNIDGTRMGSRSNVDHHHRHRAMAHARARPHGTRPHGTARHGLSVETARASGRETRARRHA